MGTSSWWKVRSNVNSCRMKFKGFIRWLNQIKMSSRTSCINKNKSSCNRRNKSSSSWCFTTARKSNWNPTKIHCLNTPKIRLKSSRKQNTTWSNQNLLRVNSKQNFRIYPNSSSKLIRNWLSIKYCWMKLRSIVRPCVKRKLILRSSSNVLEKRKRQLRHS